MFDIGLDNVVYSAFDQLRSPEKTARVPGSVADSLQLDISKPRYRISFGKAEIVRS